MFYTTPKFHFAANDWPHLKKAAGISLSGINPRNRLELLARAMGHRTQASLKAALESAQGDLDISVDIPAAEAFAQKHSLDLKPVDVYLTLAGAAFYTTLADIPELHTHGYGKGSLKPRFRDRKDIIEASKEASPRAAIEAYVDDKLRLERETFVGEKPHRGMLHALCYFWQFEPPQPASRAKKYDSHRLKHRAEKSAFGLPDGTHLSPDYVENGLGIAAAVYAGFAPLRDQSDDSNPNVAFKMPKAIESLAA